ncbi:hypothetical protein LSH36_71g06016 [Paralvinella palmiformis]|uniref:Uncharacterized protein n=1 Tax=Paralvinella palmiformis TaxID=53620 RepID=A0AAD9NBB8_9ANNE|nr:hypothetical protein LSH36_71g06016 [Paralvinella palmiformis]
MASTQDTPEVDPSQDDAFQRELTWCIEQLEIGLLASKSKLPTSRTHEAVRILKVLRNPKAAYAKKRQYMRATFGDYRQKMDAETKRYAVKTKKISVKPAPAKNQKCTFFKKSLCEKQESSSGEENSYGFCFNFDIDPNDTDSGEQGEDEASKHVDGSEILAPDYFRSYSSDNNFRFNFNGEIKD